MDRINGANTVDIGGGKRGFRKKNKAAGLSGTEVTEVFMNNLQEENLALIEGTGQVASDADQKQVFRAVRSQKANWMGVFAGTANGLTAAPTPTFAALADLVGVPLSGITGGAANTGAMTFAVNGLAATAITWQDGTALANGDLPAGSLIALRYDGTAFRLEYHFSPTRIRAVATVNWGGIGGTLSAQGDLAAALNAKLNLSGGSLSGSLGIGGAPAAPLDIYGNVMLRGNVIGPSATGALTVGADPLATITAGGYVQCYAQSHASNPGRLSLGSGGVERIAIVAGGALALSGASSPGGQVVASNGSGIAIWQSPADLQPQLQYEARWSAATNSATLFSAATAWVTLPLNTLIANSIASASASAGVISLPAGTYRARFWGAATPSGGSGYKFRLRNTTAGTTVGLSAIAGTGGYYPQIACPGECEFTLATTSNIELQGFTTGGTTVSNLSSSDGEPLIGASVTFTKVK